MFGGGLDSPVHILLLLIVVLLVFGAKRLPEVGRSLGSGIREFRHALSGSPDPQLTPVEEQRPAQEAPLPTDGGAKPA